MAGLSVDDGGWHFWVYYVILTLSTINGASLVRFMAYFAPDRDAANAVIGTFTAVLDIFNSASACTTAMKDLICAHKFLLS